MATYELPREVSMYLTHSAATVNYLQLSEQIGDPVVKEFFFDALKDGALSIDEFIQVFLV